MAKIFTPEEVRQLRKSLGMTQEGFAHMIGVTFATVNRWERGKSVPQELASKELSRLQAKVKRASLTRS